MTSFHLGMIKMKISYTSDFFMIKSEIPMATYTSGVLDITIK